MVEVRTARQLEDLRELLTLKGNKSFAVAYLRNSGLALIKDELEAALASLAVDQKFRFLVYLDGTITDPDSIGYLLDLSDKHKGKLSMKYFKIPYATFHPKLYINRFGNVVKFLSGSYNLTRSALDTTYKSKNIEHGLWVSCTISDDIGCEVTEEFECLWKDDRALHLDREVLENYRLMYVRQRRQIGNRRLFLK